MPLARHSTVALAALLLLAACAPAPAATVAAPTAAPTNPAATATPATTAPAALGLTGTWGGALVDPSGSYPVHLVLDQCETIGGVCGQLEYLDPGQDDTVQCASELTFTGREGERFSFSERYVYRGWMCFTTTYAMTRGTDGSLAVEQFAEPGVACCTGTMTASAVAPEPSPFVSTTVAGLGRITAVTPLGGATTQYPGVGAGSLWLPLDDRGAVARIDPATGSITTLIETGDPGALEGLKTDPHGVAVGDAGIWVAQAADRAVGRIDPATNTVVETVPLQVVPYVLALDGTTLWVTSFEDDRVVRIDLVSHKVVADIPVNKPTGIAVGLGGVWVVRHRDDILVRIDPATNKIVKEISLGDRGPSDVCGMCVENVVVGEGSVWTANNEGRSVSRIDPKADSVVATIALALRPWAVAAGGGGIWASQFDTDGNGAFLNETAWGVARIDPATNTATTITVPGALSVFWAADALWVTTPGRRGDVLVRIVPEP